MLIVPGQGSRCVGGLERRPRCGCVWGGIMGREVAAPGGKEFPCITAAQAWPSWEAVSFLSQMVHAHDLSLRGIRWLTTQKAPPKLPEPGCQLLPLLLSRCTTVGEEAGDRVCLGKALPYPYPASQVGFPGSSNAPLALKA